MNKENKIKITVSLISIFLIIYTLKKSSDQNLQKIDDVELRKNTSNISAYGVPYNTNGKIPGNPQLTEGKLQKIYAAMLIFKKKTGNLPMTNFQVFVSDVTKNFQEYGFKSMNEANAIFHSEDTKFGDLFHNDKVTDNIIPFFQPSRRPDGSEPSEGFSGKNKDVLLFTNIYFHENISEDRSDFSPIGFYIVLWEDGSTERIPIDKVRFVPNAHPFQEQFPNQEGSSSKSYGFEDYKKRKF